MKQGFEASVLGTSVTGNSINLTVNWCACCKAC